jgi:DNA-directed RNA polymerase specialized sigma24 family protein
MSEDWFDCAVEQVSRDGRDTCAAIEAAVNRLKSARDARAAGQPLAEMVGELITAGGRETRLGATEAFRDFERSVASMRARVVGALIDEDGLALSEVARLFGISRQAVARLYRAAAEQSGDTGDQKVT